MLWRREWTHFPLAKVTHSVYRRLESKEKKNEQTKNELRSQLSQDSVT